MQARIGPKTGLILKVHTSNYRIEGFTTEVRRRELATIARAARRAARQRSRLGHAGRPRPLRAARTSRRSREAVAEGADLVTFSGDKLLGGPQAGFIVGRKDLIAAINRNPMKRALRVDKMRLAALEATLQALSRSRPAGRAPADASPARAAAGRDRGARPSALAPVVADRARPAFAVEVVDCASQIGSGALPLETVPSAGLAIRPPTARAAAARSTACRRVARAAGAGDRPHRRRRADPRPALPGGRGGLRRQSRPAQ